MKVIIAGGRDFCDYDLLKQKCDKILSDVQVEEIISGRCELGVHTFTTDDGIEVFGADGLAERYAKEKGVLFKPFPADWKAYGKAAGPIRNMLMALYADALIAFWDEKSSGTKDMIYRAKSNGLKVRVIVYRKPLQEKDIYCPPIKTIIKNL